MRPSTRAERARPGFTANVLVVGAWVLLPGFAVAAPCAGFNDVDATSAFCANVEWVRNRGVTRGCVAGLYCPDEAVSRLSMAAFMNRLGTALSPFRYGVRKPLQGPELTGAVTCLTPAFTPGAYARRATVDASFTGRTVEPTRVTLRPYYAVDGAPSAQPVASVDQQVDMGPDHLTQLNHLGVVTLQPGTTYRFSMSVLGWAYPPVPFIEGDCMLAITVHNEEFASPP